MSGGRGYSPQSTSDLSATYDDMMENLRVRYVNHLSVLDQLRPEVTPHGAH